jgi:hypothetical protein
MLTLLSGAAEHVQQQQEHNVHPSCNTRNSTKPNPHQTLLLSSGTASLVQQAMYNSSTSTTSTHPATRATATSA